MINYSWLKISITQINYYHSNDCNLNGAAMSMLSDSIIIKIVEEIYEHRVGYFTLLTSSVLSLWSSYMDNQKIIRALFNAFANSLIALSIGAFLQVGGIHNDWLPIVGALVSLIGVERIRETVINLWDIKKNNIISSESNSKNKPQ